MNTDPRMPILLKVKTDPRVEACLPGEIGIREFAVRAGVTYDYAAKLCKSGRITSRELVVNKRVVARLIPVSEVERYKTELKRHGEKVRYVKSD